MCIAVWVWQSHPRYPLLLLLNRDEYHDRSTEPVGWWGPWGDGEEKILGGRDGLAGGTWMGCTKDGRVTFLTNVREPNTLPFAKTRGDLPLRYLKSKKSPLHFAEELVEDAEEYNGFNLILADISSKLMVCVTNRPKGKPISIELVSPGFHVLSNAKLDTPWPKAERLQRNFEELLLKHGEEEVVEKEIVAELLGDTIKANRERLPNTGCDPELEYTLSSVFIDTKTVKGRYGTRSMSAFTVKANGEVGFFERYLEGGYWKEHTTRFHLDLNGAEE